MDTATGAIRRTRFTLRDGDVEVELLTDYVLEPRLDLWVPSRFTERYDALGDRRRREQIPRVDLHELPPLRRPRPHQVKAGVRPGQTCGLTRGLTRVRPVSDPV